MACPGVSVCHTKSPCCPSNPNKGNPIFQVAQAKDLRPSSISLPPSHLSLNYFCCFLRTHKALTVRTPISLHGKALVTCVPHFLNYTSFPSSGLAGTPAPTTMA